MRYCCFSLAEPADWTNTRVYLYSVEDEVTAETFQQAGLDYLNTPEGQAILENYKQRGYGEEFTWSDFFYEIPEDFLKSYGIYLEDQPLELLVDRFEPVEYTRPF